MRWLSTLWFCILVLPGSAQLKPDLYVNTTTGTDTHATIAILPFYCVTDPEDFKKAPEYQAIQERQLGFDLQSILYYKMISFSDRFTVTVQDVNRTNHLLREAGLTDLRFPDPQSVAQLLKVDAVIICVITHDADQYLTDTSLQELLARQQVPEKKKRKDMFLSLFGADGTCLMTYATNSEILRNLYSYEVLPHFYLFTAMQYLPYWKGDKIKVA